ncbi:MAG: YfhO family protein, partial [Ignavibacteriaceae bacterium]
SFLTGIATSFCTGIIVFLYIGHVTKLTAIWAFPLLLMQLMNFQTKIRFIDIMLTVVIMAMMFLGWHVQIIFYIFFAILIYFIYFFIRSLRIKDRFLTKQLVKSAAVIIFSVIIGLLIMSDSFTQIWEYNPFSTRGTESILEKQEAPATQSESDFYKYATDWSFSPGEVLTMIIPSYYGFGNSTYQGPLSQNQPADVNTYFGQMPFVDVAVGYMGVVIFFLAIFSMVINWKDPLIRFLTILSIIALLISFGRTFPVLFDLMFNYFPMFDKFRVPSMILVLVHLSFPLLAGLGLVRIVSLRKEPDKKIELIVKRAFQIFSGLFLITLFLASPIKDWFIERVISSGQRGSQLQVLHEYMADMFINDARLAFLFSAAVFGLIYAYVKAKLSPDLLILAIAVIVIIDLMRIDLRGEKYVEYSSIEQLFDKPEYIKAIESTGDNSVYRILNLKQDRSLGSVRQNSNFNAYFLQQDLFGYSAIKPRAFQDYMDILQQNPANPTLWRMANVKYLVFDRAVNSPAFNLLYSGNKNFVYQNMNVLPRAYFVNQVQTRTAIQILNAVRDNKFDPRNVAFIENDTLTVDKPDSTGFVKIDSYEDENINISVNASGSNFLFLGDTYYSGSTEYKIPILNIPIFTSHRWRAYIDGNETRIYRTNHDFRGIVVPKGKHQIEFSYLPESFVVSKYFALILSSLSFAGLIFGIILIRKRKPDTKQD